MTERKHDTGPEWVDPDDAPEWTDEMFDAAEFSVGGKVIRPARGVLGPSGVVWHHHPVRVASTAKARAVTGAVQAKAGGGVTMADKKTSSKAAKSASKVLRDGRTGKDSKTAAGSALSQKEGGKKKR